MIIKMSANDAYYWLWPSTDDPVRVDRQWEQAHRQATRCPCRHSNFEAQPNPIHITDRGANVPLSYVDQAEGQTVVRQDLRSALSPELDAVSEFGMLIDTATGPLEDRWTILAKVPRVIVRSKKPFRWFCPVCRQLFYQIRGQGHLLRSDLTGSPILLPTAGGLIVCENLYTSRLKGRKWKGASIGRIPLVDKPQDDLPADLSSVTDADVGPPPDFRRPQDS